MISSVLTAVQRKRAIDRYGSLIGGRLATTPATGVVSPWVSLLNIVGWLSLIIGAGWLIWGYVG